MDNLEIAARQRIRELDEIRGAFKILAAIGLIGQFIISCLFGSTHFFIWLSGGTGLLFAWWAYQVGWHAKWLMSSLEEYIESKEKDKEFRADTLERRVKQRVLPLVLP